MEAAHQSIQKARSILLIAQTEIEDRLKNPTLHQWEKVNLDLYEDILPFLSLPQNINEAQKSFKSQAKDLFASIDKWKNEIGCLETDLKHKQLAPEQALLSAKAIEKGANSLSSEIKSIRRDTDCILQADDQIRSMLNLQSMLQFSQAFMSGKDAIFSEGLQIYCLLEEQENSQCQEMKLSDLFTTAMTIDEKLKSIDLSSLPKMAADIIAFHLGTSRLAIDEIKQFVEKATTQLTHEQKKLDKFKEQFEGLKDVPTDMILKSLAPAAESLQKIMMKLQTHIVVLERIKLCLILVRNLNQVHSTIKNHLIEALAQKTQDQQSPLNPYSLAHKQAADYFMGLGGMIRSFKLMFKSLGSSSKLNQEELTRKIEECITSCNLYFGAKSSDIAKMEAYINDYLSDYSRPFPYDSLFKLMRNSLGDYGSRMEKFFYSFPVGNVANAEGKKGGSMTLGKLVDKIEIRRENLKAPM